MTTPFDSDIDLWLCALRAAGRSPVTVAGYRHTWSHFLTWLDRPATDCTRRDALAYVKRLRQTNKPSSVAHHVCGLRAGYSWRVRDRGRAGSPLWNDAAPGAKAHARRVDGVSCSMLPTRSETVAGRLDWSDRSACEPGDSVHD